MTQHAEQLDRAWFQFLEGVDSLWDWHYRRRLAVLRGGKQGDDWMDGVHVPSKIWGGIQMCCWFANELWSLQPSPWEIRADAHEAAYKKFVEEVQNGGAESKAH